MNKPTILVAVYLLLLSTISFSQAGKLDKTFGNNGIIITSFGSDCRGYSVAIQPDEKILVSGYTGSDVLLLRFNNDGTPDNKFGSDGHVITNLFGKYSAGICIALQKDEKIIVMGRIWADASSDIFLLRYKKDGAIDSSFGINGVVITDFGNYEYPTQVALEPGGKIIVGSYIEDSYPSGFALIRYKHDGQLDSSFGIDGKTITTVGAYTFQGAMSVDKIGKIVFAGHAIINGHYHFAVERCKQNGTPDSSFGVNGIMIAQVEGISLATCVAIRPDGKIMAGGKTTGDTLLLTRCKHDGTPDSSFGENGNVFTILSPLAGTEAIAVQQDERVLLLSDRFAEFVLIRYKRNGSLDSSFGKTGIVYTDVGFVGQPFSMAIQKDEKVVVVGSSIGYNEGLSLAIVRYIGENNSTDSNTTNNFPGLQKQKNTSSTIHLYPNPVKDVLHIEGLSSSTKTISVIDVKGKLLRQVTTSNSSYSLNTKQLSAGMYFLRIMEGDKSTTLQFVKE